MSTERTELDRLLAAAAEAAKRSWSPYSRFPVGAALLCSDGTVVTGTNVENRSYGLTICAERAAVCAAVAGGRRSIAAVAVVCPAADEAVSPCGACRQVLTEFCAPQTPVIYRGRDPATEVLTTLGELLPFDSLQGFAQGRP